MFPNKVCICSVKYPLLVKKTPYSARRLLNLVGTFNSQFDGFFGITDTVRKNFSIGKDGNTYPSCFPVDVLRARTWYCKGANLFRLPRFPFQGTIYIWFELWDLW